MIKDLYKFLQCFSRILASYLTSPGLQTGQLESSYNKAPPFEAAFPCRTGKADHIGREVSMLNYWQGFLCRQGVLVHVLLKEYYNQF